MKPRRKVGRPSVRSEAIAGRICALICEGLSLRAICSREDMPSRTAVLAWLGEDERFQGQYARACATRADLMAEEILEIADDARNDFVEREAKDGGAELAFDAEHVQRSKLRVETRKWLMAKLQPKKYGDRLELTPPGAGLQIIIHDDGADDPATSRDRRAIVNGSTVAWTGTLEELPLPRLDDADSRAPWIGGDAERGARSDAQPAEPVRHLPADGGPQDRTPPVYGFDGARGGEETPQRSGMPHYVIDEDGAP